MLLAPFLAQSVSFVSSLYVVFSRRINPHCHFTFWTDSCDKRSLFVFQESCYLRQGFNIGINHIFTRHFARGDNESGDPRTNQSDKFYFVSWTLSIYAA